MAKYKVEVQDVGGTGVGTSVLLTDSKERAVTWLAATVKEPWAGPWRLRGPDVDWSGDGPSSDQGAS